MRKIEVDEATADVLEDTAKARGVSVSQLVADMISSDQAVEISDDEAIVELERRWKTTQTGKATVPHEEVVRWLQTWGMPEFKPFRTE